MEVVLSWWYFIDASLQSQETKDYFSIFTHYLWYSVIRLPDSRIPSSSMSKVANAATAIAVMDASSNVTSKVTGQNSTASNNNSSVNSNNSNSRLFGGLSTSNSKITKAGPLLKWRDMEHLVAGVSGGVLSTLVLHPLDLIKIRFQGKHSKEGKNFYLFSSCRLNLLEVNFIRKWNFKFLTFNFLSGFIFFFLVFLVLFIINILCKTIPVCDLWIIIKKI